MPDIHLNFGGSKATRLMACTGSYLFTKDLPNAASDFAKLGSALHECMEQIINGDKVPADFADTTVLGMEITQQHVEDKLVPALTAWQAFISQYEIQEFETEVFTTLDGHDDVGGSADVFACSEDYAFVVDWKFGDGIQIDPNDKPEQFMFYAMCGRQDEQVMDMFEGRDHLAAVVIQPTTRSDEVFRVHKYTIKEQEWFEQSYLQAVKEAKSGKGTLCAGDHCKFCPGESICPEKSGQVVEALQMNATDLEILAANMARVKGLKEWISAVERAVYDQLEAGAPVEGWKLVDKRVIERWADEEDAINKLRRRLGGIAAITTRKILTPAQMRKHGKSLGVDLDLDLLTIKKSSGLTIAPESDKRPGKTQMQALQRALKAVK